MIINYTFFHKLHTIFFSHHLEKNPPEIKKKTRVKKQRWLHSSAKRLRASTQKTKNPQQQKQA
jgi:hypothetical protein